MTKFKITGQSSLSGVVTVNGSKNAATPVLTSALLSGAPCTVHNVPRVEDVNRILELIASVGASFEWHGDHSVTIMAENVDPLKLDMATVRRLRSSVLFMGALLGRCGVARIPGPGGDQIGSRPLDAHLDSFRKLGVIVDYDGDIYSMRQADRGDIELTLAEGSVTATENVILASVTLDGRKTVLHCAAADPSVQDLCWFLVARGARIKGIGTFTLVIDGVKTLQGSAGYSIMPDQVETGTFICLAAAARAELTIKNVALPFMRLEMQKFEEVNVSLSTDHQRPSDNPNYDLCDINVHRSTQLKAIRKLHNMPYPGFNPDLLQPFTVMLTQATGTSLVHDWMYEARQKYVEELNKMGAQIFIADPHRILVKGPTNLYAAEITSYDIRTGASLFIAALIASGTSTIGPAYQIDRGYERLDERMRSLGALIERLDD